MKKTTRLTALMLVLLMLCSLTVSATESTGGVSLEDLDAAAWNAIVEAAMSEKDSDTKVVPDFSQCDGETCFYTTVYANMTTLEKYAYLMGDLYTVDGTAMEEFLLHIAFFHMDYTDEDAAPDDVCTCEGVPVYAPGSSEHYEDCPWYGESATAAEHYAVYAELSLPHKACYLLGMDEAQLTAIQAEMSEADQAEMPYLLEDGIPDYLRTEEVEAWLAHNDAVTAEMAVLAKDATDNGMALNQAMVVNRDNELLWLYEGEPMATITENGYIVDIATGIVVGRYDFESGEFTMGTGAN